MRKESGLVFLSRGEVGRQSRGCPPARGEHIEDAAQKSGRQGRERIDDDGWLGKLAGGVVDHGKHAGSLAASQQISNDWNLANQAVQRISGHDGSADIELVGIVIQKASGGEAERWAIGA